MAQKHAPVNPCSDEGAHEGPRGYAHSLKDGATFVVLDEHGDINREGLGHQGLYHGDTRHVSRLALSVENAPPVLLYAATRHDNSAYVSHLLSPEFVAGGDTIDAGAIHLERTVTVSAARYYEQLHLTSYALEPVLVRVSYEVDADFRDMFEIRGIERPARGDASAAEWNRGDISWDYTGRDGIKRGTRVRFDPAPDNCGGNRAEFLLRLEPRQVVTLNLVADCGEASAGAMEASHCSAAAGQVATERRRAAAARCDVRTSNELYNRWLERSAADLDMLSKPV
ncbi:MAG TPA: glycogen debranching N-terminal domain-containing protein, partial [Woeseiaceae bacterium]|nr:glycogen debranching N-terminal domain-containing protein [Woeseiaceae bacterium]